MITATNKVVLDREWNSFPKGTVFIVHEVIHNQEGGDMLRVATHDEPVAKWLLRTVPAEYVALVPPVGSSEVVWANQGDRDATVLCSIGSEYLVEYEMPAGRVFGRVLDVLRPEWHKVVCLTNLPAKWRKALADENSSSETGSDQAQDKPTANSI